MIFHEDKENYNIATFSKDKHEYIRLNKQYMYFQSGSIPDFSLKTILDDLRPIHHFECDVLTYNDFFKKMRKECNPDKIQYFEDHMHTKTTKDKIKSCLYLISHYQLIMGVKNLSDALLTFQQNMLIMKYDSKEFNGLFRSSFY